MHFSYAGITCYYAILVGESLAANSDRAKPRASSCSRQPFKGQLNASRAQSDSKDPIKNKDFHQASKQASQLFSLLSCYYHQNCSRSSRCTSSSCCWQKKGPFTFASTVRELSKWDSRSSSTTTKNQATFLVKPLKE